MSTSFPQDDPQSAEESSSEAKRAPLGWLRHATRRSWNALRRQPAQFRARWRRLSRSERLELAGYALLVATALGMRLWDLGGRTLHYDEILHAWYSWVFSEGGTYHHTPLMHGPFLFHAAAGSYFLFGSSDAVARLLPAMFGVALVGMPFFLRQELGRAGALVTAVLLMVSPSMLYFSRFIRNDIYMAVWVLGLVIIMWRYIHRPRLKLLFAWAVLWAFAFSTKETAYITAAIVGLALLAMALPELLRWVRGRLSLSRLSPPGVLLLLLVTLTLPLWAPLLGLVQDYVGVILVNPDPNNEAASATRAAVDTGAPAVSVRYVAAFAVMALAALSVTVGLLWDRRRWPFLAAAFLIVWVTLFTSLFQNQNGFFTGLWGSLGYWIAQHPVERADQPWFFYIILAGNYEFLVAIPGLIGAPLLLWRGGQFDRFLVFWAAATFVAYSFAGEKMPWLLMGITLPLALLSGRSIGLLLTAVTWRTVRTVRAMLVLLSGAATLALLGVAGLQVVESSAFSDELEFWASLGGALAATGFIAILTTGDRLSNLPNRVLDTLKEGFDRWHAVRTSVILTAVGAVGLMLAMTVFVAGRASYSYAGFERPTEMLVYAQTGQETTWTAQQIDRIARESGKGKEGLRLLVGQSDAFGWQWKWYARDYTHVTERFLNDDPLMEPPEADVVLISRTVAEKNKAALEGFTEVGELHHLWWFPNSVYNRLSPDRVMDGLTTRESWRSALDYFFSRRLGTDMYQANGLMYVANEYAGLVAP